MVLKISLRKVSEDLGTEILHFCAPPVVYDQDRRLTESFKKNGPGSGCTLKQFYQVPVVTIKIYQVLVAQFKIYQVSVAKFKLYLLETVFFFLP